MAHSIGSCLMDSTSCCSKGAFWENKNALFSHTQTVVSTILINVTNICKNIFNSPVV